MCLCFWICTYLQYISIEMNHALVLTFSTRSLGHVALMDVDLESHSSTAVPNFCSRLKQQCFQDGCSMNLKIAWKLLMTTRDLSWKLNWHSTRKAYVLQHVCDFSTQLIQFCSETEQHGVYRRYRKMRGETKKFRNWKNEWIKWCLRTSVVAAFCWLCRSCASFGANQKSSCWNLPSLCRSMATWDVHRWTWGWVPRIRALTGLMATKLITNNYGGNHRCLLQGLESATPNFLKVQILANVVPCCSLLRFVKFRQVLRHWSLRWNPLWWLSIFGCAGCILLGHGFHAACCQGGQVRTDESLVLDNCWGR